jgi:hypothetical protein
MMGINWPVGERGLGTGDTGGPRRERGMYGVYVICGVTAAGCRGGGGTGPERPGGGGKMAGIVLRDSVIGVEGGEVMRLRDEGVGDGGREGDALGPGTTSG